MRGVARARGEGVMTKKIRVKGTMTVRFVKTLKIDDDTDHETYEPPLYADDVIDSASCVCEDEEIEIHEVELVPAKKVSEK